MKMGETEEFNPLTFEKRLTQLKDTQESIQGLSSWCLKQKHHHKKIVASWLNVLKRVKVEQRLVLFYLANDVIQYSKRKNYEFVESWGLNLQKATPLVRDEKVRHKILRIFKIWEQRSVYDEEFLSDLTGLLSAGTKKSSDDDALDFQPQQLVNKIKQCTVLEADTDLRLKNIHESKLDFSDPEHLCSNLKDRSVKDDVIKELNDGIACVERYTAALQREIVAREALLALLTSANQYYSTQRGEVKVVAYAYKNFGARVRALKRKLDELTPKLPESVPSPPSREEDVPSPAPDEDLELPQQDGAEENDIAYNIDRTFNTSVAEDGSLYNLGLSSFLSSDNPLSLFDTMNSMDNISSANRIEVISSRPSEKPDFNVNDFFKTLVPNDTNMNSTVISDSNSVTSDILSQKSQETLPGLDLLPNDGHIAPPSSFYGAIEIPDDPEPTYSDPGTPPQWNNNAWSIPPVAPVPPPHAIFVDTPASPPPAPVVSPITTRVYTAQKDPPAVDVDHRGILPPPPPPPVLPMLGLMEDVDHRLLAPPPVTLPGVRQPPSHTDTGDVDQRLFPPAPANLVNIRPPVNNQDVDHRNLISLTQLNQQLPQPAAAPLSNLDQDYRVPTMVPPPDIVESVDMDLSEDDDSQVMFPNQGTEQRRSSFNNKVLVGGNNGKTNHEPHTNLIQINNRHYDDEAKDSPMTAPVMPPMSNPFDKMPPMTNQFDEMPPMLNQFDKMPPNQFDKMPPTSNQFDKMPPMSNQFDKMPPFNFDQSNNFEQQNSFEAYNDSQDYDEVQEMVNEFEEDMRNRNLNRSMSFDNDRQRNQQMNQRFPRNWGPRTNMRPQFGNPQFGNPQFRPRNGPRPFNRWMGPRPQRFW